MPASLADKLVVAISLRSPFDLDARHRIFDTADTAPAYERLMRTLWACVERFGACLFLGGLNQAASLKAFRAVIFFDDQPNHCVSASGQVTARHAPHGISNAVPRDRVKGSGS